MGFTSDLVFNELAELLSRRRLAGTIVNARNRITRSTLVHFVTVPSAVIEQGVQIVMRADERQPNPRKRIGYVDSVNVAVMRALRIGTIFTTDGDYAAEGVAVLPARR